MNDFVRIEHGDLLLQPFKPPVLRLVTGIVASSILVFLAGYSGYYLAVFSTISVLSYYGWATGFMVALTLYLSINNPYIFDFQAQTERYTGKV